MNITVRLFAALSLLFLGSTAKAQRQMPICSRPNTQCQSSYTFTAYQLPFTIKEKLVFGKNYKSQPFYAIVLKSLKAAGDPDCSYISEAERLESQETWPDRKVFASHNSCPEELVAYENADPNFNFLAVYAGTTLNEARRVLSQIKASGRYPQAYIKRMRVILEYST
jgi:hypothetical protein